MRVITLEEFGEDHVKSTEDKWNQDGEEGKTRECKQQSKSSYKQKEHWDRKSEVRCVA